MKCKICDSPSAAFASGLVRQRHKVRFFACPLCQFIQTEEPVWLNEAYVQPINASDVGYVSRNLFLARISKALILFFFNGEGRFVDYGGGYGLFVRLMRDLGFDFYRQDKFCPNLFAQRLEASPPGKGPAPYELLTAFEVFEHLPDPMAELDTMLTYADSIFCSTELAPSPRPALDQWTYYGLDHGQHIAFYRLETLAFVTRKLGLRLFSNGRSLHLLTRRRISNNLFRLACKNRVAGLLNCLHWRNPLTQSDHDMILRALKAPPPP